MVALKEKLPCASSSDFWVRPHMVTLPARPLISAGEWLMIRNFTIGAWFLGSLTKRTPVTSIYFCSGLVLAGCPCWFAGSGLDGVCGLRRGAAGADASACSG